MTDYRKTVIKIGDKYFNWQGQPITKAAFDAARGGQEIDATESAVELAEEHGIDLAQVKGTGTDGRILKSDVEALVK